MAAKFINLFTSYIFEKLELLPQLLLGYRPFVYRTHFRIGKQLKRIHVNRMMEEKEDKTDIKLSEWMSNLPEKLWDTPLNQIAIPGSHNSFSSSLDKGSGIGTDVPAAVKTFGTVFRDVLHRYSSTQKYSLTEQLNNGIRYFDFRVSTKPNTNSIHFIHAFYGADVQTGLNEIKQFIVLHPKEIVLIDFNHFYDMNGSHHKQLVELIQKTFQEKLCMFVGVENATLNMLWENNLQVIVFYQDKNVQDNCQFWPPSSIQSPWVQAADVPKLKQYLVTKFKDQKPVDIFIAWQWVATPDAMSILQNVTGSIEELARKVMPVLVEWLEDQRAGDQGVNICIADYVDLLDFPLKVVRLNYK